MSRTAEPVIVTIDAGFQRWDELLALIHDSFAYMQGVVDPPASGLALTAAALRAKALSETGLIALAGGRIVGCAFVSPREDHLYLGKLAVARDLQGCGIGRLLVSHAEALARAAGKPALQLQTRIELTGNHKAFARLGFVETARTAHPGHDRPTSVTMRKALAGGAG
ncbi:GNAT family N-acetyltransferase [Phreatobacter sp. AB_2022a]|uniref:GNAT family N-acetyltransferase n=1 Tax=Phreatobacter sp. AB_2022a TaxID=3003134 RepID=UPI002286D41E|nr:GNAT family N-acetyltransferase [Phreatobacter sp. AB_2022a]MCZ0735881.1 GNAT family N-acetyltransferase [Phreatobacter sp. AB_2022a]